MNYILGYLEILGGELYPRIFGVGVQNILGCQIFCDTGTSTEEKRTSRGLKLKTKPETLKVEPTALAVPTPSVHYL